jgi:hypothetical protein
MRENWSITDEAAKGPSSDSRVCRSGATQGQMRTLVGDRYDKKPLAPHKRGAGRARAHRTSTPELAQTKRTVAKTACKIFIFRHFCRVSNLPITTLFLPSHDSVRLSCVGVRSVIVPRLRPAWCLLVFRVSCM